MRERFEADEVDFQRKDNKVMSDNALNNLGYGLYLVTSFDGKRHNGMICNTVMQVSSAPCRIAVSINKSNYSHDVIRGAGIMNVNILTVEAPFKVFEHFGFQSGKDVDKFADCQPGFSKNGLVVLPKYVNSCISLKVEEYSDLGSHGLFICSIAGEAVISDKETMTYAYYHQNVKPKPKPSAAKGWVCKICGYVYEGAELPPDFVCPWCKHGAEDFEPITG